MAKKQTRFDKMNKKSELNFEVKKNPITTTLKKADKILNKHLVLNAFFNLKHF